MRLIFMGTPDFAVHTLEALLEAGHEVVLAVTQPDKPRGRGGRVSFSPVKECALEHGIAVYQPKRIRDKECIEEIKKYNPDIIIVAAFGQILPKEILDLPPHGCVNVHASLLPKYRGAAPIQWAVINGDAYSGVTMMRMDAGLDTGDIIDQVQVPLAEDETGGSLFEKLAQAGASLCVRTLEALAAGTAVFTPQDQAEASYVSMISKAMGEINWSRPAKELERLIRGLDPWPSAYTRVNGKILKVWKAGSVPSVRSEHVPATRPGTVVDSSGDSIIVQTGEGCLALTEVQLEGKRRMSAADFLRGFSIPEGSCFG